MIDINKKIMEAMKAHDKVASETYKLLKAKILEFKTAKNAKEYTDAEEIKLIQKMIQERQDSICIYLEANRGELADAEWAQVHVLEDLLPALPTKEDVVAYLNEHYPNGIEKKQMGLVIKEIKEALIGVDGKMVADYVKNILVQGRCALVKYIQMYKIFIINSLLTIYIESFLVFKGIKFSEYQSVYLGFEISMFFLMFSKAKPLNKVNSNKAQKSIFTWISIVSILGQFCVHLLGMNLIIYFTEKVDPFYIKQEKSFDERFNPNLINSIVFLFQVFNQIIIFVVNYQGEPFMENMWDNSLMLRLIFAIIIFGFIIIFDLYPQLNEDMELVELPEDINYKITLIIIMLFNFTICYIIENWRNLFGYFESIEKTNYKKRKK